jgi:hypothetical protein
MRRPTMKHSFFSRIQSFTTLTLFLFFVNASATAQLETVLYNFGGLLKSVKFPRSGLAADQAGNLYGSAECVGHCWGEVFELNRHTPPGQPWAFTDLFEFYHATGQSPSGLVLDKAGNLYGTGADGGIYPGFGVAFELRPSSFYDSETLLYSFQSKRDGWNPQTGLILDEAGNAYGTTPQGGPTSAGTVFELTPSAASGGPWTRTIIHSFDANIKKGTYVNGCGPAGLTRGPGGTLYGAAGCGRFGGGVIYQLTPPASSGGGWEETIVYAFGAPGDTISPSYKVVVGKGGVLYGVSGGGGANGAGAVYQLTPPSIKSGPWTEQTLYSFTNGADGGYPNSAVTLGDNGVLYGTASDFLSEVDKGLVYQLTPPVSSGAPWTETVLHTFTGGDDGGNPMGGVLFLGKALYGTTNRGGTNNTGIIYEITF